MTRRPMIFVAQYTPHLKFSEAEKFGEVVFLSTDEFVPQPAPDAINDRITAGILAKMNEYIPSHDFIITTGGSLPNVVIGTHLAKVKGEHSILKWSNREKKYELFKLRTR